MTVSIRDFIYKTPGRVFIGRPRVGYQPHPHPAPDAIEVPEEYADAWLAHSKRYFPDAYIVKTWPKNNTLMARYNGTPENSESIPFGPIQRTAAGRMLRQEDVNGERCSFISQLFLAPDEPDRPGE